MPITVRPATPGDVAAMLQLLEEMDRFYGVEEFAPLDQRQADVTQALFSAPPAAYALLAWDGSEVVGLASYSFLWPAMGVTRSLFLKELYVNQASLHRGVGRSLMQHLFEVAAEHHCSRVEWMTERDNQQAQQFYDRLGFDQDLSKVFYRVRQNGLNHRVGE